MAANVPNAASAAPTGAANVTSRFLDRNSRQIGTFGLETMLRLSSLKVLIAGTGGSGIEVAKNLCLAGVHTISLYDPERPTVRDLGTNFALTAASVAAQQETRASLSAALLADLNPGTRVRVVEAMDDQAVSQHDAVIVTSACPGLGIHGAEIHRVNKFCREHQPTISFLYVLCAGPLGSIFVDHGDHFVTTDPDGHPCLQKSITEIVDKVDKNGRSYSRIRFATPEGLAPGSLRDVSHVWFSEVKGMHKKHDDPTSSINSATDGFVAYSGLTDPANTVRVYPSFTEQGYSSYQESGFLHEKKERIVRQFRSLASCLQYPPPTIITDSNFDGSAENFSHLAVASLLRFGTETRPVLPTAADYDAVLGIANKVIDESKNAAPYQVPALPTPPALDCVKDNSELPQPVPPPPAPTPFTIDSIDDVSLKTFVRLAHTELQPLSTIVGAIVAQEVVKITGKYTPIYQFLHLNALSVIATPEELQKNQGAEAALPANFEPENSRYDNMIEIFGRKFVQRLRSLVVFMVGCGALGCENIKNFALCGFCTSANGRLTVTDNDRIEISNLSRQFLFREDNVGQPKSVAAANRVHGMNADMVIDARQDFVGPTTEHLFPESFWAGLDVIVNALDNIPARLFVDAKCVFHEKILVEAGTMGTGGNVDIIVPHKTTSYADGGAADETGGIPMCTLRNFPYIFDHCIEWARALFADLFSAPLVQTQQLQDDPEGFVNKLRGELASKQSAGERRSFLSKQVKAMNELARVVQLLIREVSMKDCVMLAWQVMHSQFRDRIASLIQSFPKDAKKKNGELFWSGHRKFPKVVSTGVDRTFEK